MNTIISQVNEGISRFPDLQRWIREDVMEPDSPDFDALSLLEGDPDILRCDGYIQYFISVEVNDVRYVLTSDELSDAEREMLECFFSDDFRNRFCQQGYTWDYFNRQQRAIAYRGGSGYLYSIWNYCDLTPKPIKKENYVCTTNNR